jgi:hypothetical protein
LMKANSVWQNSTPFLKKNQKVASNWIKRIYLQYLAGLTLTDEILEAFVVLSLKGSGCAAEHPASPNSGTRGGNRRHLYQKRHKSLAAVTSWRQTHIGS